MCFVKLLNETQIVKHFFCHVDLFKPLFPSRAVCAFTLVVGFFFSLTDSYRMLLKRLISQAVASAEEGLFSV